jgi:hypothetical protein
MAVIRDFGITTISADKDTAQKLREEAKRAGVTTWEYLRQIVKDSKSSTPTLPGTPPVNLQAKTSQQVGEVSSSIEALGILFKAMFLKKGGYHPLTEDEYRKVKNSPLHFLLDEEIIGTARQAVDAVKGKSEQMELGMNNDQAVSVK